MNYFLRQLVVVLLCSILIAATPKKVPYAQYVHASIASTLDQLQKDGDYPAAITAVQSLFDQSIRFAADDHLDCIRETDFALRLVTQLQDVPTRDELLPYLRKHDTLAATLVFLVRDPRAKSTANIYQVLDRLRQSRGDQLEPFSTLTAAICVVHYKPFSRHINENEVKSIDPIDIFDYYVKNENRMYFGVRNVPAELLVYVVDTTANADEMNWALNKYAGNSNVGALFFDIDYDYEYYHRGTDKKVTVMGYNLPNILKYGGVCADQAYYASAVGKAIGVPTSYDVGESGESAHAWVGFLQATHRTGTWNFNSGRYESYQGVRGNVMDPQTRRDIPDSYVSLLGEMIGTRAVDRQTTVALTDAADRMTELGEAVLPPDSVMLGTFSAKPRPTDVESQLGLIELALRQSVAYPPAWFTVRDLAVEKKLTLSQKHRWSDLLLRLGAKKYPDFTLAMLMPMVQSIDDPLEQDALLQRLLPLFKDRLDLSASILMAEAALWESQNQTNRAGQCYMNVVERYTNGGPFVLAALTGAEKLLSSSNRADQVTLLYQQAWNRTEKPGEMAPEFMQESNWYRIGRRYAVKLIEAGDVEKATEVASTLGINLKAAGR